MKLTTLDFSKYDRVFVFGCSFTNWYWPTWGDILIHEFNVRNKIGENWAAAGCGNQYIFNSVMECDNIKKFNERDLVIVQYTDTNREDRYVFDKWVYTHNEDKKRTVYGDEWVKQFHDDRRAGMIRDYAYIHAIQQLLEYKRCGWNNFSMVSITRLDPDKVSFFAMQKSLDKRYANLHTLAIKGISESEPWAHSPDVLSVYKQDLMNIEESFLNIVFHGKWPKVRPMVDKGHPTPKEHLQFLEHVYTDFKLSDETYKFIEEWEASAWNMTETPAKYYPPNIERL